MSAESAYIRAMREGSSAGVSTEIVVNNFNFMLHRILGSSDTAPERFREVQVKESLQEAERWSKEHYDTESARAAPKIQALVRGWRLRKNGLHDAVLRADVGGGMASRDPHGQQLAVSDDDGEIEEHVDPESGRTFYFDPATQESSWERPATRKLRGLLNAGLLAPGN